MSYHKSLGRVFATVALAAATTFGFADPSGASGILGGCGAVFNNVTVDGGAASWNISCANGTNARIEGFVEDTKKDGKCAYIKAFANTGDSKVPLAQACPKGKRTNFDWTAPGATDIAAYLFTAP